MVNDLRVHARELMRVVGEIRTAGVLKAPPAMLEEIYDWCVSVVAARETSLLNEKLNEARKNQVSLRSEVKSLQSKIRQATKVLDDSPGVKAEYAAYKSVEDHPYHMMALGYPFQLKFGEFNRMRKSGDLADWWSQHIERLGERMQATLSHSEKSLREIEQSISELQPLLIPGVEGGDQSRKIPLNFKGWDYEAAFADRFEAAVREQTGQIQKMHESHPEIITKEVVEAAVAQWRFITVNLTLDMGNTRSIGRWNPFQKTLFLKIPDQTSRLKKLRGVIRHELLHVVQTFISDALHIEFGMPSKKIRTPDISQGMSGPLDARGEALKKKVLRQLLNQGVNPVFLRNFDFHSMDDVEFMTKLADNIDYFNSMVAKGEIGNLKAGIRVFTGQGSRDDLRNVGPLVHPSDFFLTLRRAGPGKYRAALKEFTKAVL